MTENCTSGTVMETKALNNVGDIWFTVDCLYKLSRFFKTKFNIDPFNPDLILLKLNQIKDYFFEQQLLETKFRFNAENLNSLNHGTLLSI